jgi:hypothetical protein
LFSSIIKAKDMFDFSHSLNLLIIIVVKEQASYGRVAEYGWQPDYRLECAMAGSLLAALPTL